MKRLMAVFVLALVSVFLIPGVCAAEETPEMLRDGDFLYSIDGGCVTITGWDGEATAAEIPGMLAGLPVTKIGERAFAHCLTLSGVTIPDSVTEIGDWAFSRCEALTELRLSNGLVKIGKYSFRGCSALSRTELPDSLEEMGDCAFAGCTALTEIELPKSLRALGLRPFAGCDSLVTVRVSPENTVFTVSDRVLYEMAGRTLVLYPGGFDAECYTVPEGTRAIGRGAFSECTKLRQVVIPGSVTEIAEWAFYSCTALEDVEFFGGVTEIGSWAFSGCEKLTALTLPETLRVIGYGAFFRCRALPALAIPDSVTEIKGRAFVDCISLGQLKIPDGVTEIGDYTFHMCWSLESITIPDSVTSFGERAFSECDKLTMTVGPGSFAEGYAKENGIPFVYRDSATRVMVASDLHYIAPTLTDHGAYFTALTESGDGKLMRYIEEITDAFLAEVSRERPDALLLTGDLTFNGAVKSHEALAEKLRALEAEGIPVLVLTGNHDLDNPDAAAFSGSAFTRVESAGAADFRRIYGDFGFDEARSLDPDSLSYVYMLKPDLWVLMLDFNTQHDPCGISEESLRWVRSQLDAAREAGAQVLTAGHQNLYQQTMFRAGYVIEGAEALAALFREYGVPLYLSGHLHCQHRMTVDGLTEIATSALSVYPCQYGVLTFSGGRLRYEARATDVSAWAEQNGKTDAALLHFADYARGFFDRRTESQVTELLALFPYTQEEIQRLTAHMVSLNRAYFSGDLTQAAALDPDGSLRELWERHPSPYLAYLSAIRSEFGSDYRVWSE